MVESLISLLIVCVIVAIVVILVLWVLGELGMPEPLNRIARALVILIAALIILYRALPLLGVSL